MITSGLVVDGVGHSLQAHLQPYNHQAVAAAVHNHRMSYVEPSAYLKSVVPPPPSQQQQQQPSEPPPPQATPEFLRPLPKPAPVNPLKTSRVSSKYSADCRPVNLTAPKEPPPPPPSPLQVEQQHLMLQDDGRHHPYSVYAHPRLYVNASPYHPYPMHQPPAPYGVYTSPYAPVIPRDARHHLMHPPQERRYSSPPSKNGASAIGIGSSCVASPSSSPPEQFKVPNGRDNKQSHQLQQQQQQHHHHLQQQQQRILPPPPPPLAPTTTAVLQSVVLNSNNNNNNNNNINNNIIAEPPLKKSRRVSLTPESSPPSPLPPPPPKMSNFTKGSLIRLANGNLKKVEDMRTEDFLNSVEDSDLHKIDPSTVVRIAPVTDTAKGNIKITLSYGDQRSRLMVVDGKKNSSAATAAALGGASKSQQVEMESGAEHPYFVFGRGWASWDPAKTLVKYGLPCQRLQVGDVCVSLSKRTTAAAVADSRATPPLPPLQPPHSKRRQQQQQQQQHLQHSVLQVAAHQQQQQQQQQQQHLLHHNQSQQQQQQHHHVMMHHSAVHKAQQLQLLRAEDEKNGRNKRRWSAPDPEAAI